MDFTAIVLAFTVLGALGLIFGLMLGVAGKKLAVETDPRIDKIRDCLGGANCGACGLAGCDAFAEAVVKGEIKPEACTPGGSQAAKRIAAILGVEVEEREPMVARVICQGTGGIARERYEYDGYNSCRAAASLAGGPKLCRFACVGLGDCMSRCVFNAITMVDGVARINEKLCKACGACAAACPRGVIELRPLEARALVRCRNSDSGRLARSSCMKACIACKRCVKACEYDAVTVENGFARIDVDKCTRCTQCAKVCPCGCITVENA